MKNNHKAADVHCGTNTDKSLSKDIEFVCLLKVGKNSYRGKKQ